MRRINSVPALLFGTQLSGFTQSLPFAWLPMVCLMPYWSYGDLCWQMLSKQRLGVRIDLTAEKRDVYLVNAFYRLMPRLAFQAISFFCGFSERTDLGNGNLYTQGYK